MTIKLHMIDVTSAGKKSQPYILLGPLGHITSTWKMLKSTLVSVCVFWVKRFYLRNGFYSEKTKDLEFLK